MDGIAGGSRGAGKGDGHDDRRRKGEVVVGVVVGAGAINECVKECECTARMERVEGRMMNGT